jgi:hypothetical protein
MTSAVTITVKLTPQEWDDVREAVAFAQSNSEAVAKDRSTDVKIRQAARENAVRLSDLRRKFA